MSRQNNGSKRRPRYEAKKQTVWPSLVDMKVKTRKVLTAPRPAQRYYLLDYSQKSVKAMLLVNRRQNVTRKTILRAVPLYYRNRPEQIEKMKFGHLLYPMMKTMLYTERVSFWYRKAMRASMVRPRSKFSRYGSHRKAFLITRFKDFLSSTTSSLK